jgi:hypothetical protein
MAVPKLTSDFLSVMSGSQLLVREHRVAGASLWRLGDREDCMKKCFFVAPGALCFYTRESC